MPYAGKIVAMPSRWLRFRISLYLLAVSIPTAALVYLGLDSVQKQAQMTTHLLDANRRFAGEVIAADLESRTFDDAESCLGAVDVSNLPVSCYAGYYVVVEDGELRYPTSPTPFIRRLANDLRQVDSPRPGRLLPLAYTDPPAQVFYRRTDLEGGRTGLLAIVLDLDRIAREELGGAEQLSKIPARLVWRKPGSPPPAVFFRTLFPFWEVIATPRTPLPSGSGQLVLGGAVSLSAGIALIVGVCALLWDSWRRWKMTQLQANFVSAVAHELKTPLTGIRFYVDLLGQCDSRTA